VHDGLGAAAIASTSRLAPEMVCNYFSTAMVKLGAATRAEAARTAWEEGWI
jgi:DNA-binding NarL/FixJ family response regulator